MEANTLQVGMCVPVLIQNIMASAATATERRTYQAAASTRRTSGLWATTMPCPSAQTCMPSTCATSRAAHGAWEGWRMGIRGHWTIGKESRSRPVR